MFDAKTIRLAESLRPDLDFSVLGTEEFAILKIVENATGGGVVPIYDADIINGIASFSGVTKSKPLVSLKLNIPVTQTGNGTPSPDNIRDFVGVSGVNIGHDNKYAGFITWNQNVEDVGINGQSEDVDTKSFINFQFRQASNPYAVYYRAQIDKPTTISILIKVVDASNDIEIIHNGSVRNLNFYRSNYGMKLRHIYFFQMDFTGVDVQTVGGIVWENLQLIDLTVVFGDTKANEIYAMEQAQTGSGVAYFKGLFPNDYYNYNSGTLSTVRAVNGSTNSFYTISFGQTVYSAILDVLNGVLSITHEIKTIDENSSIAMSSTNIGIFAMNNFFDEENDNDSINCNCYQRGHNRSGAGGVLNYNPEGSFCCNSTSRISYIKDTRFTTLEDYKTWLSTNPVKIAVKLAEPIEIQLTPTVINTLIGENVIFADVANVTECKYTRK